MTDDNAALINELREHARFCAELIHGPLCGRAADALSRLTVPLLPKEIAGLIEWLEGIAEAPAHQAAWRLRALAQEVERSNGQNEIVCEQLVNAMARIKELEADLNSRDAVENQLIKERDELLAERDERKTRHDKFAEEMALNVAKMTMHIVELVAERDAIRAKTIEECASEASSWGDTITARHVAERIHALAQTDESKTESGE